MLAEYFRSANTTDQNFIVHMAELLQFRCVQIIAEPMEKFCGLIGLIESLLGLIDIGDAPQHLVCQLIPMLIYVVSTLPANGDHGCRIGIIP